MSMNIIYIYYSDRCRTYTYYYNSHHILSVYWNVSKAHYSRFECFRYSFFFLLFPEDCKFNTAIIIIK